MTKQLKQEAGGEPDWAALRVRYEAGEEYVDAIAESAGIRPMALSKMAKAEGWSRRKVAKRKAATRAAPEAPAVPVAPSPIAQADEPKPITSTRQAIHRLKELVQARIARLEHNLASGPESERGINAANLLARTLEKVLELEEQQRKQARLVAAQGKRRDDAWREELALRLARLARGDAAGIGTHPAGGEGAAAGLASLGT